MTNWATLACQVINHVRTDPWTIEISRVKDVLVRKDYIENYDITSKSDFWWGPVLQLRLPTNPSEGTCMTACTLHKSQKSSLSCPSLARFSRSHGPLRSRPFEGKKGGGWGRESETRRCAIAVGKMRESTCDPFDTRERLTAGVYTCGPHTCRGVHYHKYMINQR